MVMTTGWGHHWGIQLTPQHSCLVLAIIKEDRKKVLETKKSRFFFFSQQNQLSEIKKKKKISFVFFFFLPPFYYSFKKLWQIFMTLKYWIWKLLSPYFFAFLSSLSLNPSSPNLFPFFFFFFLPLFFLFFFFLLLCLLICLQL